MMLRRSRGSKCTWPRNGTSSTSDRRSFASARFIVDQAVFLHPASGLEEANVALLSTNESDGVWASFEARGHMSSALVFAPLDRV
jgi:hypothetical protein